MCVCVCGVCVRAKCVCVCVCVCRGRKVGNLFPLSMILGFAASARQRLPGRKKQFVHIAPLSPRSPSHKCRRKVVLKLQPLPSS